MRKTDGKSMQLFWRRTDMDGLERLALSIGTQGIDARSTVLCLEAGGCRIDYRWTLDAEWRTQSLVVERWNDEGHGALHLERVGSGWRVNGTSRPDLDGATEPDLSVTPFCNTPPIRRTPAASGEQFTLDTAFIDGPALTVARSRQRYLRQSSKALRYIDLGLSSGFEADLTVDDEGLIISYQHLFQRIAPPV
ncbi:putative glycolipid-binding domain-containing protein [uncultured Nitratireductor sp.]|uniref:putative glycolipid-binding domain-containing protein n=1 Tax=uncultured Nitratireductor sp. TaxID=520953 RepID=UPI0025E32CF7|nr:putative glycolipid-binding domain-containing protein [uncultured Nitratireductor sp.]